MKKIAILGAGRMGSAFVHELVKKDSNFQDKIIVTNHKEQNFFRLRDFNIKKTLNNKEAVLNSDILILAVRPQQIRVLVDEIKNFINPSQIIISFAIGVPLKWLGNVIKNNSNIFHVHPSSTIMAFSHGVSFMSHLPNIPHTIKNIVSNLFLNVGEVKWVKENDIQKFAVFAGCSPAFMCYFLNRWKETALKYGINEQNADLVIDNMFHAIKNGIVTEKLSYSDIIHEIATPNGVTQEGIKRLEPLDNIFMDVFNTGLHKIKALKKLYV